VAVYVALGLFLELQTASYLIIGIPLTIAFQRLIVRKPIYNLWLRNEEKFQLSRKAWLIILCFLIFPIYKLASIAIKHQLTLTTFGYYSVCIAGCFAAGYCFSHFTKKTTKDFLLCFCTTGLARMSLYFMPLIIGQPKYQLNYARGFEALLTYIPVAFIVEEVIFRGMLDTYVYQSDNRSGLRSALFISILWGLWHLPLSNSTNSIPFIILSPIIVSLWGILLSIFWRRSGNLAVPVFSHAIADAIRDAFK